MKKVKIKDIALKAGVSTGTVDRVLHGRGKVSPRTREKVDQAIAELRYKPNIIARTLARQSPMHIYTLLPYPYQDLYWKKIREGAETGMQEYEAFAVRNQTRYYDLYDKEHYLKMIQGALEEETDALIVGSDFHQETKELLDACYEKELPVVLLNSEINTAPYLSFIGIDPYAAGRVAGRIILSTRGLQSVLTLHLVQDLTNTLHLKNKELGLRDIILSSDLPFTCHSLSVDPMTAPRRKWMKRLSGLIREHDIDTLYVSNSKSYLVAKEMKTEFPDLYIIGHDLIGDNIPLLEQNIINVIIDQRGFQQGYLSIKILVDHLIRNQSVHQKHHLPLDIIYPENLPFFLDSDL